VVCELRACCKRPAAAFFSTPDAPRDRFRSGEEAPVIAVLDEPPPPEEAVAHHEAAHGLVFHAYGVPIDRITITGQAHVDADTMQLPLPERAMMFLAGPAATDAYRGWLTTLFAEELDAFFERVDEVVMGSCDECQAALIATVAGNCTGCDRASIFREAERRANEFVRLPTVRAAIRALAAALMQQHTLIGADAHSIINHYIEFGELNAEKNQKDA
jgi:hypothetical protein